MDYPTIPAGFPIVGQAASVQFAPGARLFFPRVASRALIRCVRGSGRLLVDGEDYDLTPSRILILRWGHSIEYRPDPDDPFLVQGMHVIPWHGADHPVELSVPHDPRHALAAAPWRADSTLIAAGVVVTGDRERPELATLMHYAAQVWSAGIPTVATAKALGVLAMRELTAPPRAGAYEDPSIPPELRRLLVWIEHNLGRDITAVELAGVAGRGVTTVNRLFRRELQTSPMNWVIERRIDRARQLLSRTHQTVAQVAHAVGCADPYYFSRLFKDRTGMSPSQWRNRHSAP